ncbi:hypothetical protein [Saccharopolyspora spinosa]|nr:hypothetical protein [Saccharopolyspora spinosa]
MTDSGAAEAVRDSGADVVVVANDEREVVAANSTLDGMEASAPRRHRG